MLNRREIPIIILVVLILAFIVSLGQSLEMFMYLFLSFFLIIMINVTAKKIAAFYLDSQIEIKLWEMKRYGYQAHQHFKRSFPTGAFFPFIWRVIFFPLTSFIWMACLVFEVESKVYRAAKRYGIYTFSEMTEWHIGLIAAAGILANLFFAVVGYLIGLPQEMNFVALSVYYTFFNMLPFSSLDGNKIFFGNLVLWTFLATIVLISLLGVIIII